MNKIVKAGLLMITLVIPALIFAFLQLFATNHYAIPYFNPELDPSGKVLIMNKDTVFKKQSELAFTELPQNVSRGISLKGNATLINYLPANCDQSCDIIVDQLKRVIALTESIDNLKLITFTDSSHTNNVLKERKQIDSRNWSFYAISNMERDKIFIDNLHFDQHSILVRASFPIYMVVLLDSNGYFRGYYKLNDLAETDRLMAELKVLEYEKEH
mgnify:CR=1 FL=1